MRSILGERFAVNAGPLPNEALRSASRPMLLLFLASVMFLAACGGSETGMTIAEEITVPEGFVAYTVASGFTRPTSVAVGPAGDVFVSQLGGTLSEDAFITESGGSVIRLEDSNGDGFLERQSEYVSLQQMINGIGFSPEGLLYVSSWGRISIVHDKNGDGIGDEDVTEIITGLPIDLHQNNGFTFGPMGKLYLTNGSTCDECPQEDERSATILQADQDGSNLRVYASGVRNSFDLVFDQQGRLWATDNGSDTPCNTIDELNLIVEGGDYGWPYAPACDSLLSGISPTASLGFNRGAAGITINTGRQFPAEYEGNLFIALWGSNDKAPIPAEKALVRGVIDDGESTPQVTIEEFATGFANPIDVTMDRDGSLLVLDFGGFGTEGVGQGKLYRIVYTPEPGS